MPKTAQMRKSKFLKKEDVGQGTTVTIATCVQKNVAQEDDDPEMKWCLLFTEFPDKPMVLNATNIQMCEQVCGSDDTDEWKGQRLILWNDESVQFGGKRIGGIRVRAPKAKPKPVAPSGEALVDDDIPF